MVRLPTFILELRSCGMLSIQSPAMEVGWQACLAIIQGISGTLATVMEVGDTLPSSYLGVTLSVTGISCSDHLSVHSSLAISFLIFTSRSSHPHMA